LDTVTDKGTSLKTSSARIGTLVGLILLMLLSLPPVHAHATDVEPIELSEQAGVENQEGAGQDEGHGQEAVEEDPMLEPTALPTNARFIGLAVFLVAVLLSILAIRNYLGRLEEERQIGL
jgi:hypothetical protein